MRNGSLQEPSNDCEKQTGKHETTTGRRLESYRKGRSITGAANILWWVLVCYDGMGFRRASRNVTFPFLLSRPPVDTMGCSGLYDPR